MPRRNLEELAQAAYFQQIRMQEKRLPILKWIYSSQAGMFTGSKAAAGKAKAGGMVAGIADITIPMPMWGYHGAYIELKIKPNKLSPEQELFRAAMRERGYFTWVAIGKDAADGAKQLIAVTEAYLGVKLEVR